MVDPGCSYDFDVALNPKSVGAIFASLRVFTKTESGAEPEYHADPDNAATVLRVTKGQRQHHRLPVPSTSLTQTCDEITKYVEFHNVGTGPRRSAS